MADDILKMDQLLQKIIKKSDSLYPNLHYLYLNSKIVKPLSKDNYSIFLSHAGEQKHDYVSFMHSDLEREGVSAFFDVNMNARTEGISQIHYAAFTCKVAIVVLSKEYIQKKWPMLELCIFAARLRKCRSIQKMHATAGLSDDEKMDENFSLLLDFYSPELKETWFNVLEAIPFVLKSYPPGVLHSEDDLTNHRERVIQRAMKLLE